MLRNGVCKGLQVFFIKLLTGLIGIGFYLLQGELGNSSLLLRHGKIVN